AGTSARPYAFQRGCGCGKRHRITNGQTATDRKRISAVKDIAGAGGVDDIDGIGREVFQMAILVPAHAVTPARHRDNATTRQLNRVTVASASPPAKPAKRASAGSENTA